MNAKNFMTRTDGTKDDWQTPGYILDALGQFDLDPCANMQQPNRCATQGYVRSGLDRDWQGRVWCNPPYGDAAKVWVERCASHGNAIVLIPARVGSKWFHKEVFQKAHSLFFFEGRIAFINAFTKEPVKGSNHDSVLIAYGEYNSLILETTELPGRFCKLKEVV